MAGGPKIIWHLDGKGVNGNTAGGSFPTRRRKRPLRASLGPAFVLCALSIAHLSGRIDDNNALDVPNHPWALLKNATTADGGGALLAESSLDGNKPASIDPATNNGGSQTGNVRRQTGRTNVRRQTGWTIAGPAPAPNDIAARPKGQVVPPQYRNCGVLVTSQGGVGTSVFMDMLRRSAESSKGLVINNSANVDGFKHKPASFWEHDEHAVVGTPALFRYRRTCYKKVLVIVGDPIHTLESVYRRFKLLHINMLRNATGLGNYEKNTTLQQIYEEIAKSGEDTTGLAHYISSWREAQGDRENWPEVGLVTSRTLYNYGGQIAKWIGVRGEELKKYAELSYDESKSGRADDAGQKDEVMEKVSMAFRDATEIVSGVETETEWITAITMRDEEVNSEHRAAPSNDTTTPKACGVLVTSPGGVGSSSFMTQLIFAAKGPNASFTLNNAADLEGYKHAPASFWKDHNSRNISSHPNPRVSRIQKRIVGSKGNRTRKVAHMLVKNPLYPDVNKTDCFHKVLVIVGDPIHTITSTFRRFDWVHLNKLREASGLPRWGTHGGSGPGSLRELFEEIATSGEDNTGVAHYIASWHDAQQDRAHWPEVKLVTTRVLFENAVDIAKWIGVSNEELSRFRGLRYKPKHKKAVVEGLDDAAMEKALEVFRNVTSIIDGIENGGRTLIDSANEDISDAKMPPLDISAENRAPASSNDTASREDCGTLITSPGGVGSTGFMHPLYDLLGAENWNASFTANDWQDLDGFKHQPASFWKDHDARAISSKPVLPNHFRSIIAFRAAVKGSNKHRVKADLNKVHCFRQVLVIVGDPIHTIESTHRRFKWVHLNKLREASGLPRWAEHGRSSSGPGSLRELFEEIAASGKDNTGVAHYISSWHDAKLDRANWPEVKIVTTKVLFENAVDVAKWIGVPREELGQFKSLKFNEKKEKKVVVEGLDDATMEKALEVFRNVTNIIEGIDNERWR